MCIVSVLLQVLELTTSVEGLEKERDFYFSKLRDVEILCQQHESDGVPVIKQILDILYATEVMLCLFVQLFVKFVQILYTILYYFTYNIIFSQIFKIICACRSSILSISNDCMVIYSLIHLLTVDCGLQLIYRLYYSPTLLLQQSLQ